jgi:DNA topoisomerase-1
MERIRINFKFLFFLSQRRKEGASVNSEDGYTLVIAEKPDAALRIAQALDDGEKPKKIVAYNVPYYEAHRNNEKIIVVPALGHLYTVAQERGKRNYYPVFNFKWFPKYAVERGAQRTKTWLKTISKLANGASTFINGCDYDIEGSLIGYTILKYACNNAEKNAKRMKFSTLTKKELEEAYNNLMPHLDFSLAEAGQTRHEVDWLYGINLSRALTLAANNWSKKYATLSTGRVQGPTLKFLVEREKEIQSFVPTPFWVIKATVEINGAVYEAEFQRERIERKVEADEIVKACAGKTASVKEVEVRTFRQAPPVPFDIGTLQAEAYRLFGFTPSRTLSIAERLYLDALISYPRTSSQKLPPTIGYGEILASLRRNSEYQNLASELLAKTTLKPNEGVREDPAHPAVYPTGNLPERSLDASEKKIFDLIVKRFMAVFGDPAIKQGVKVTIAINGYTFFLHGRRILEEGWLKFYQPYSKSDEVLLPHIEKGQEIVIKGIVLEDRFSQPPPRYNPSSLLKLMEEQGIGTKATRAEIIDTLYDRGYIRDERIVVTELGFNVTEILESICPAIISVELTKELESKMEKIETEMEVRRNVLVEAVGYLKPILENLKMNEKTLGQRLSEAIRLSRLEERVLGSCPVCKTGKLLIIRSKKTGKQFVGCTNYRTGLCKASAPLPQFATIKPTGKVCTICQWPIVRVQVRNRRPWNLCIYSKCPTKEERKQFALRRLQQRV